MHTEMHEEQNVWWVEHRNNCADEAKFRFWKQQKMVVSVEFVKGIGSQVDVISKLEMLGSIVSRLASPRKILGEIFFEHSG